MFAQDRVTLDARWKELQREAHPDKFASQGSTAQRLAMQWSVRINEAYGRLKDPLKRASYLCDLNGAAVMGETNTAMPASFLMRQLTWREELDDASTACDIEKIAAEVDADERDVLLKLEQLIDIEKNFAAASEWVRSLMFTVRFAEELRVRLGALQES